MYTSSSRINIQSSHLGPITFFLTMLRIRQGISMSLLPEYQSENILKFESYTGIDWDTTGIHWDRNTTDENFHVQYNTVTLHGLLLIFVSKKILFPFIDMTSTGEALIYSSYLRTGIHFRMHAKLMIIFHMNSAFACQIS